MRTALASDQVLLLLLGKLDGSVWHSRLSDFSALRLFHTVDGRHVHSDRLLYSSLRSQNLEQVLPVTPHVTILLNTS
jgi:hypothetical protein